MGNAQDVGDELELAGICRKDCGGECVHVQGQAEHKEEGVANHRPGATGVVVEDGDAGYRSGAQSERGIDPRPEDVEIQSAERG